MKVSNDELYTIREAMRQLNVLVAALELGVDLDKVVLTKFGKMKAVILSVESYEQLAGTDNGGDRQENSNG